MYGAEASFRHLSNCEILSATDRTGPGALLHTEMQAGGEEGPKVYLEKDISPQRQNPRWLAPEIILSGLARAPDIDPRQELVTWQKGDVFSFGVIMWEVATLEKPWEGLDDIEVERHLLDGHRLPIDDKLVDGGEQCPIWEDYKRLMNACWNERPEERPCFNEILSHVKSMKTSLKDYDTPPRRSGNVGVAVLKHRILN